MFLIRSPNARLTSEMSSLCRCTRYYSSYAFWSDQQAWQYIVMDPLHTAVKSALLSFFREAAGMFKNTRFLYSWELWGKKLHVQTGKASINKGSGGLLGTLFHFSLRFLRDTVSLPMQSIVTMYRKRSPMPLLHWPYLHWLADFSFAAVRNTWHFQVRAGADRSTKI